MGALIATRYTPAIRAASRTSGFRSTRSVYPERRRRARGADAVDRPGDELLGHRQVKLRPRRCATRVYW